MHARVATAASRSFTEFTASRPPPQGAGIGLRAPHYRALLETRPAVGWLEVHSENYFGSGGQPLYFLERARSLYPLSLHGVGLSLGSVDPLNREHLSKLKSLVNRFEPALVSEHLSWSSAGWRFANDLLPLPYTEEALDHFCARVTEAQEFIGRQILVENISTYLRFRHSTIPEWEFVAEVSRRTGCGLLLDVNNIYVNAVNHDFDPAVYIDAVPVESVQEIHLAGFDDNGQCLIDTHGKPVHEQVWSLYRRAVQRLGPIPTLIEWDTDLPALSVLVAEAGKADAILESGRVIAA